MFSKFRQFYRAVKKDFAVAVSNIKWNYKLVYDTHNLVYNYFTELFNKRLPYRQVCTNAEIEEVLKPYLDTTPINADVLIPKWITTVKQPKPQPRRFVPHYGGPVVIKDGFQFRSGSREEARKMAKALKDISISDFLTAADQLRAKQVAKTKLLKTKKAKKGTSVKPKRKVKA